MSCIVYQTDKKTGVKYAYESVSYWDKEKQQPRSKRTYIGRVDPVTNEIIRKKERNTHSADELQEDSANELEKLRKELALKEEEIRSLTSALKEKNRTISRLSKSLNKIREMAESELSAIQNTGE